MESKIIVTEEMLKEADTYIPLLKKQEIVRQMVPLCTNKVKISFGRGDGQSQPMPDRYQLNNEMTAMCLMGVLAKFYLKQRFDFDDKDEQMPANVYDEWAGSHVINQLERMKGNKECGTKVYDLLYDYRDFKGTFLRELDAYIDHQNDVVARMSQILMQLGAESPNSEQMEETIAQLKAFAKEAKPKDSGGEKDG